MKRIYKNDLAEALSNDAIAQAHVEEVAFKLFDFADKADQAAKFDK